MFAKFFSTVLIGLAALFGVHRGPAGTATTTPSLPPQAVAAEAAPEAPRPDATSTDAPVRNSEAPGRASLAAQAKASSNMPGAQSQSDLEAIAGPLLTTIPLGDNKYSTSGPKKGYLYFCRAPQGGGGGAQAGLQTWIHGSTWTPSEKTVYVHGSVSWPNAVLSNTVSGSTRTLAGNGLPVGYTTGVFPVSASDPAASYDRNPNSISAQNVKDNLPANPTYSDTPYCMGMESGLMLSGIPIFAAFDAELRDAVAYEVQDSCGGHPEKDGEYHYHGLSACFKDIGVSTVLGYALDGFPITGPKVAEDKYLSTDDLDVCHGITSEVLIDGKKKTTYHYVMTQDFPYSVSCFRGKPAGYQVIPSGPSSGTQSGQSARPSQGGTNQSMPAQGPNQGSGPPQEAISACSGKSDSASCSFDTPNGTMNGVCRTVPEGELACVPAR